MRLTCLRGYPGSGKSTAAREMASQTGAVIVSRDSLRKQMYGRYSNLPADAEDAVTVAEEAQVQALLESGRDCIVDDMNLNPRYLTRWASIASRHAAEFDVYDLLTDPMDCVVRDSDIDRVREGKHVGHAVIGRLAKRWPMDGWPVIQAPDAFVPVLYDPPKDKPFAIVCDIDGTAAHLSEKNPRSHYDYSRVSEDEPDYCIRDLLWKYVETDVTILFVSGREDSCRGDTEAWLQEHNFPYDTATNHLYMRRTGDFRNDVVVKGEIFDASIRSEYQVLFALDDRDRVVRLWRSLGIKCLQVAEGNF